MVSRRSLSLVTRSLTTLALTSCAGGSVSQLVEIADLAPGEACAHGGIVVHIGNDDNGDGVLDADELVESHTVCTGRPGDDGFPTLTLATPLERGDANCPHGGVRVDLGLDNGDGGGVPDNGVLESGEIDRALNVCDGAPAYNLNLLDPPAALPSQPAYVVDLSGGAGTSQGGEGGEAFIGSDPSGGFAYNPLPGWLGRGGGGLPGGHVKVFRTGDTDASINVPTPTTNLGPVALVVSGNRTVAVRADSNFDEIPDSIAGLTVGDPYLLRGWSHLYRWDGTGGSRARVTGLHVQSGGRLTLGDNSESGLELNFDNDIRNEGVIATPRTYLELRPDGSYTSSSDGLIDLSSTITSGGTLILRTGGSIVNDGTLRANGGGGGNGGTIELRSTFGQVANRGAILVEGHGTTTTPASGGRVTLSAQYGAAVNTGTITATGSSESDVGGTGGYVGLQATTGDVVHTGTIDASGGDSRSGCTSGCQGGWARSIVGVGGEPAVMLGSDGGALRSKGRVIARGGAGRTGTGGSGGMIAAYTADMSSAGSARSLHLSGDLSAGGGDGASGGSGGSLAVFVGTTSSAGADAVLLGYSTFDLSGGTGPDGGAGGAYAVMNGCPDLQGYPTGGAVSYADVIAHGGAATTGVGGAGGRFLVSVCRNAGYTALDGAVGLNAGTIDLQGGNGGTAGGPGGYFVAFGRDWAENRGDVSFGGGDGAFAQYSSLGYLVGFEGPAVNSGDVAGPGGDASDPDASGGEGALFLIIGDPVTNSGTLSVPGGAGGSRAIGGTGGRIELTSMDADSVNTGSFVVDPGAGSPRGVPGVVRIDGQDQTALWFTP